MSTVTVIREHPDRLCRQTWRFFYDERSHGLRPSNYVMESRPSVRHKYRIDDQWNSHGRGMTANPSLPADVQAEAIQNFIVGLGIALWEERR